jgi:hypothetical protein
MIRMQSRRLARSVGALAIGILPGMAIAQDKLPPGPPPEAPGPLDPKPLPAPSPVEAPRARLPEEVLPGVPATASDPAPVGTRSVRVDIPRGVPVRGAVRPANRPPNRIEMIEGVVTKLYRPGKDLPPETIRIRVDPARTWEDYTGGGSPLAPLPVNGSAPPSVTSLAPPVTGGSLAPPRAAGTVRPAGPPVAARTPAPPRPGTSTAQPRTVAPRTPAPIDLVLTARTYVFAHARTPDGVDLYGVATHSTPADHTGLSDELATRDPASLARARAQETNFTNIREGSFVFVRYHRVNNLNEASNVNLIELPLSSGAMRAPARSPGRVELPPRVPYGATTPPVSAH